MTALTTQRKVAELDGWNRLRTLSGGRLVGKRRGEPSSAPFRPIPDYTQDLNAIRAAVQKTKGFPEWHVFGAKLLELSGGLVDCINASAEKRAEAYVAAMQERSNTDADDPNDRHA